ncbi:hypothetical protein BFW38_06900 [Terasakiispira papahanaumokuakeensis]|uniref:Ribosomal RNA large subunit methyltransferase J n=1 Tax=Terasakiispira papahanaumokuakeensis TaxID=197479 RepID=A0A1E2V907_9GAMM|nr:23S rRNA (adenine(2030)-N(6))-methyltransferase RlmJ [Terasakiispira papahanaumokuakeensis]ODC03316.1 hypothetical protein BFW38_06900 [Terasakiispira papahanaumokuakeensis]
MLSYRHGFHAGNHADVLKHMLLIRLLRCMTAKPKPMVYLDTHAGGGRYDLQHAWADKTGEAKAGVRRLLEEAKSLPSLSPMLDDYYQHLMADSSGPRGLRYYPGSPMIASQLLREEDRLLLCELHSDEVQRLRQGVSQWGHANTAVHCRDAWEAMKALLPTQPRRALVMIDPAYEVKQDYQSAVKSLLLATERFAEGVYALWYPMLPAGLHRQMLRQLERLDVKGGLLDVRLQVRGESEGMHGSGVFLINPPWQFEAGLKEALQQVSDLLAEDSAAEGRIRWVKPRP